jgi:hypothetical protein
MMKYPRLEELERFFLTSYILMREAEEFGSDYNDFKFVSELGQDKLVCHIEPAEDVFSIVWTQSSVVRLSMFFRDVVSLTVSSSAGVDRLIGQIKNSETDQIFKLTLKPDVSFDLGTAIKKYD